MSILREGMERDVGTKRRRRGACLSSPGDEDPIQISADRNCLNINAIETTNYKSKIGR